MDGWTFLSRLTAWAFAGAAVGLLVGLLLLALDVVDNPFWLVAAGIGAAAVLVPVTGRREPDREG
ncbi:hypothetical protein [Modestobacter versicolor]|uniref:CBS-domain-containing membrane protein n=1 Tax=Modestobacter versicolor TaxID=429133 RepID=A0A323V4S8_9ACTN|nr:hypothetical protein [Modestobacter versicolor]MBB3676173.1 CBS-domain-containing membrane protein [Modestobacter versicolor]PZA19664.1 hypothetical protein DMO24_19520 [Modestobacter versicolor]